MLQQHSLEEDSVRRATWLMASGVSTGKAQLSQGSRTSHLTSKPPTAQVTLSTGSLGAIWAPTVTCQCPWGSVLAMIEVPKGCLSDDPIRETKG